MYGFYLLHHGNGQMHVCLIALSVKIITRCCVAIQVTRMVSSPAWPDHYIFIGHDHFQYISARKNIGSGIVPIAESLLTPPSQPEVLKCLLSLPQCL